ncbi:hypothetical protein LIER_34499 [Lithospermum erythrorhizon]|uniref:Zinc knuckle CX2CX4HX4C domain-containing protein n=1 Tax=Lithospermum erythrorhizon TaxID=34254 RepID=A0AAV3S484_LITER
MKLAFSNAWNCQEIIISRVTGPILHIFFPSLSEKKQIMETGPWCFDNHLIIMKDWSRGEDPLTLPFDNCIFWIQVRGLKPEFFTWEVANKLDLRRLVQFQVGDKVAIGYLAYERLPNLCFKCELLGHLIRQCLELGEGVDPRNQCVYDLWIKVLMEKSWIVFNINDEPQDALPRKLEALQPNHNSSTRGMM